MSDFDCIGPMGKTLVAKLRESGAQTLSGEFLVGKKYKIKNPTSTDESRFGDLVKALVSYVELSNVLTTFIKPGFYPALEQFIVSQYLTLKDTFIKGAYTKMIDALNRVFNPKKTNDDDADDDDSDNPIDELTKYVKKWSPELVDLLNLPDVADCLYYCEVDTPQNTDFDYENFYNLEIIKFYQSDQIVFNVFCKNHSLWVSQTPIVSDNFKNINKITVDQFMQSLMDNCYQMNSAHYTTLDTLKRDYVAHNITAFKTHILMLPTLYAYSGNYLSNQDFNHLDELQLRNTINGFPNGFDDDVSKNCAGIFNFSGTTGNVVLSSLWLCVKPLDKFLNKADYDAFVWTPLTIADVAELIDQPHNLGVSLI
jgi:hypothetical protein